MIAKLCTRSVCATRMGPLSETWCLGFISLLRAVYTGNVARYDCHPSVCNILMAVYAPRYPLMFFAAVCRLRSRQLKTHKPRSQLQGIKLDV